MKSHGFCGGLGRTCSHWSRKSKLYVDWFDVELARLFYTFSCVKHSDLRHQRNLSSHCLRSDSQEVQAASQRDIDLTQFRKVLKFDPETATVKAESGVTMRQLCTHTLSRGFIPAVVPSCGSVTVGGAIAGIATGSTSFSHGFFHDCVVVSSVIV